MSTLINNFNRLENALNAGGAPWFQVVLPADIDTIPDRQLDQIPTAITLVGGANAYNILATTGSVQWTETPRPVNGRLEYTSVYSFVIPKDRADVLNYAQHLNNRGVVAIVRDANGQNRLMGTKNEPATFRLNTRTLGSAGGNRNEHRYEIVLTSAKPVPFYDVNTHLPVPANVCPPVPGISVTFYSDPGLTTNITSADFGDTVYIAATASGQTPTEYRFFIGADPNYTITVQPGASISHTINSFSDVDVYVESTDGATAPALVAAAQLTVNADADALAFIAAHNSNTGSTMGALQQQAVQGFFQRLKGSSTSNGSDIWAVISADPDARIFPMVPINDSTASYDGYKLDCVNLANGSYHNFITSDLSVEGVKGGTGKYFNAGVAPSAFGQNDISVHYYSRTNIEGNYRDVGASDAASYSTKQLAVTANRSGQYRFDINNTGLLSNYAGASSTLGFYSAVRDGATSSYLYRNGALVGTSTSSSVAPTASNVYFHTHNMGGTLFQTSVRQLCFYAVLPALTSTELMDLQEAVQWFQANVITGGREV